MMFCFLSQIDDLEKVSDAPITFHESIIYLRWLLVNLPYNLTI
jgi:hypothetical protein